MRARHAAHCVAAARKSDICIRVPNFILSLRCSHVVSGRATGRPLTDSLLGFVSCFLPQSHNLCQRLNSSRPFAPHGWRPTSARRRRGASAEPGRRRLGGHHLAPPPALARGEFRPGSGGDRFRCRSRVGVLRLRGPNAAIVLDRRTSIQYRRNCTFQFRI